MRRLIEWSLAVVAAGLCVVGVALIVANQALVMNAPGDSWWPLPGLILLQIAVFGLVGLAGVIANREAGTVRWRMATWIAAGALAALGAIGWFGFSVIVFALGPAVLFGLAALLADWRQRRGLMQGIGALVLSAGINTAVVVALIAWANAESTRTSAPTASPSAATAGTLATLQLAKPKAVYLVTGSGHLAQDDLNRHPEVAVVRTFRDLQERATDINISLWIDKDTVNLANAEWLMQGPQKLCPLVVVGYNNALFAYRENLRIGIGAPISGPYADWSTIRLEPGFSVWVLQPHAVAPSYTAVMRGYDQPPTVQAIFAVTDPLIGNGR
jgi:hypothetical protein